MHCGRKRFKKNVLKNTLRETIGKLSIEELKSWILLQQHSRGSVFVSELGLLMKINENYVFANKRVPDVWINPLEIH